MKHWLAVLLFAEVVVAAPARAEVECRLDVACPTRGLCTADGDTCVIGSPVDCLSTPSCQSDGECSFDPATRSCRPFAKLRAPGDPSPQPAARAVGEPLRISGNGCKETPACRYYGKCALEDAYQYSEACTTSGEPECKTSFMCTAFGHCGMNLGGHCLPWREPREARPLWGDDDDSHTCGRGRACKLYGFCHALKYSPDSGDDGLCRQAPSYVAKSFFCKRSGRCDTSLDDSACARSELCQRFGRCAAPAGDYARRDIHQGAACVATDCANSEICRDFGACHLLHGRCVLPPERTPPCELEEVRPLKATASSAQKPWTSYTFGPENLVDRDLQTSWQPEKKKGVGASFEIVLPREVVVAEIHIANGFQRRDGLGDLLRMNGVAGHVQVEIGTERLAFEMAYDRGDIGERYPYRDGMYQLWGWTPLKVPPSKTAQFKVTALSVTPGLVWDDLAISEVRVFACREAKP